jgi:hypothetical protein
MVASINRFDLTFTRGSQASEIPGHAFSMNLPLMKF